jgi:hypothetical protein
MGIDCDVKVGNKYTNLDRWYVFNEYFDSGRKTTKSDALMLIRKALRGKNLKEATKHYKSKQKPEIRYHKYWLLTAKKEIKSAGFGDSIVFYHEHDLPDEYWDSFGLDDQNSTTQQSTT